MQKRLQQGCCDSTTHFNLPLLICLYRKISKDPKLRTIYLLERPEVSSDPAKELGVHEDSIGWWVQNYEKSGSTEHDWKWKAGRTPILGSEQLYRLQQQLLAKPKMYVGDVHQWINTNLGVRVSETARKAIEHLGFTYRKLNLRASQRDEKGIAEWRVDFRARSYRVDQLTSRFTLFGSLHLIRSTFIGIRRERWWQQRRAMAIDSPSGGCVGAFIQSLILVT